MQSGIYANRIKKEVTKNIVTSKFENVARKVTFPTNQKSL